MEKGLKYNSKPFTKKEWRKAIFSLIGLITLICIFIWIDNISMRDRELLNVKGKFTIATTIETRWRKRGKEVRYYFSVDNRKYEGWEKIPIENWEEVYVIVPEGQYRLTYYPENPKIHKIDFHKPISKRQ